MAYTLSVGRIRCHILSDGKHRLDGGGFFGLVPRVLWQEVVTPDEQNLIPGAIRCLLVESEAGLVLVDTGHGDKYSARRRSQLHLTEGRDRLVADLATVGFGPEDVSLVILTHLHNDHVGGATRWEDASGTEDRVVPTFPLARHLVQVTEMADAAFPNERTRATYLDANWRELQERGLLEPVRGDQHPAPGIRTQVAPGHTAGLQIVWVEDGGESLLFLGDACSWAVHLERLAWVPSYDLDPMTSIETKRRLQGQALDRNALLVFQHDARVVTGRLQRGERGPKVQPLVTEDPEWDGITGRRI